MARKNVADAAKANRSVFYHSDGTAKTVGEVHAWAVSKIDASPVQAPKPAMIAAAPARMPRAMAAPTAAPAHVAHDDADDSFGFTVRGSRFLFSAPSETTPASASTGLPSSPRAFSAGLFEILAAFTSPSLGRRQA